MLYDNVSGLVRVLVVGTLAYISLVTLLRISGKRTLAQLNAFDFIVTVALGSTLATIALSSTVAWAEGALTLALLAALQFVVVETNGTVSVITREQLGNGSALDSVAGWQDDR